MAQTNFLHCTVISSKSILVNWTKKHSCDRQRRWKCDVWCACNNTDIITTPSHICLPFQRSFHRGKQDTRQWHDKLRQYGSIGLQTTYLLYFTVHWKSFTQFYFWKLTIIQWSILTERKQPTQISYFSDYRNQFSSKCARHKTFIRHSYYVRILQWSADYNVH